MCKKSYFYRLLLYCLFIIGNCPPIIPHGFAPDTLITMKNGVDKSPIIDLARLMTMHAWKHKANSLLEKGCVGLLVILMATMEPSGKCLIPKKDWEALALT